MGVGCDEEAPRRPAVAVRTTLLAGIYAPEA